MDSTSTMIPHSCRSNIVCRMGFHLHVFEHAGELLRAEHHPRAPGAKIRLADNLMERGTNDTVHLPSLPRMQIRLPPTPQLGRINQGTPVLCAEGHCNGRHEECVTATDSNNPSMAVGGHHSIGRPDKLQTSDLELANARGEHPGYPGNTLHGLPDFAKGLPCDGRQSFAYRRRRITNDSRAQAGK